MSFLSNQMFDRDEKVILHHYNKPRFDVFSAWIGLVVAVDLLTNIVMKLQVVLVELRFEPI